MSEQPLTDVFFDSFDLHPSLLSGLHATGFTRCTPIQALSLPFALAGRDVAGQAQTGTGKTGAFLVAVLNRLLTQPAAADRKQSDPRAVIIAPTRELAIQIDKDFRNIGRDTGLKSALIYGGVDYDKQRDTLRAGCDLIIATPGRLIDYLKQNVFSFNSIEAVVMDEADRMFDLGFIKDIRFLLRRMPPREQRQGMLFSATLSYRVLELAFEHMNSPEKVTAETESVTASRVRQVVYFPAKEEKIPLLINLLSQVEAQRSMIFVNTKIAAEKVTRALDRQGFTVATLSGDVPQTKRERLLNRFQNGDIELLVATDVAARGLHVPAVSHVFNYDLPHDAEDYVHRIGRTARLGAEGEAISFACDLYAMGLPDIEAYIEQKIPTASIEPAMLEPLPPRPRAAGRPVEVDDAEDDARNTLGAPDKKTSSSKRPPQRTSSGGRTTAPRPRRESPQVEAPAAAVPAATAAAAIPVAADASGTGGPPLNADGTPRKRRRRGGRGRSRREGGDATAATAPSTASASAPASERNPEHKSERKPERKPRREQSSHGAHGGIPTTPPPAVPVAPAPVKPGFFKRVARLFGSH